MNVSHQILAALAIGLGATAAFAQTTKPVVTWTPSNAGTTGTIVWNQSGNGWIVPGAVV